MRVRFDLAVALAFLALLGGGCSNGSGAGDGGTPTAGATLSRDDYAQQLAAWLCDDLAACCGETQSFDRAACVTVKHAAELHRVAAEESHSGRAFDEAMAATCAAKLKETPATCGAERRVSECFRTYDGTREIGEECSAKIECRGGLRGDVGCVAGRCTARLATGEACQDLPQDNGRCDVCRPDARCRLTTDGATHCVAYQHPGVAGDVCAQDPTVPLDPASVVGDCAAEDGLYCSGETGLCVPFLPIGASCTLSLECGPFDARCVNGACSAGLPAGAVCTSPFYDCGSGLYCRFDEGPELTAGHCAVPAGVGEACDDLVRCAPDLGCSRPAGAHTAGTCITAADGNCTSGLAQLIRQANATAAAR